MQKPDLGRAFLRYDKTMTALLSLKNVAYQHYSHSLLSGLTFAVKEKEVIGLLGINGAGKSTTLKLLAGTLLPSSGTIQRDNDLRIGYLSDKLPLIPQWTVKKTLKHCCQLHGMPTNKHQQYIEHAMQQCDITHLANRPIQQLSKGNQQRVGLAQAIIHRPNLLILDEPTSGLDPSQLSRFRQLITDLKPQTSVVFSSHAIAEIQAICDRVIVIHNGQQAGEIDLSQQHGDDQQIAITFATTPSEQQLSQQTQWLSGENHTHYFRVNSQGEQDQLLFSLLNQGLSIQDVNAINTPLEKKFLTLIEQVSAC